LGSRKFYDLNPQGGTRYPAQRVTEAARAGRGSLQGGRHYKILFYFKALLWGSIILLLPPPPTCKAYPIAILLHDHCAIYARPLTPSFFCQTAYNIGGGNIV